MIHVKKNTILKEGLSNHSLDEKNNTEEGLSNPSLGLVSKIILYSRKGQKSFL
jgi:hypothetical protein